MLIEIAKVTVNTTKDHYDTLISAIQKSGFTIIEKRRSYFEVEYTVAKEKEAFEISCANNN